MLVITASLYDSILYGYAFRSQWMWYNGVPNSVLPSNKIATLIVWKDYNCQAWSNIQTGYGGFSSDKIVLMGGVLYQLSYQDFINNIWETAFNFIEGINGKSEFSSSVFTVVMSQDPDAAYYGTICLKDNYFLNNPGLKYNSDNGLYIGSLYMFKTR